MEREEIKARAEAYLKQEKNETFTKEVESLLQKEEWKELEDRFYTDLEFGTGGLRGVIGGGYNRMNPFVVGRATTGFAQYVNEQGDPDGRGSRSVAIAHDSRRYSREFAMQAARVFSAHGIKAYLFSSLRPTPELSYAVRELNCSAGLVITASHNPPQYNGYKVYWSDGSQVVAPHDKGIIDQVMAVEGDIPLMDEAEAKEKDLIEEIDEPLDSQFVEMVKRTAVRPELLTDRGSEVTVVYTPLHGTGAMMVERVLGDFGVTVHTVPEQREPDGEFPTVEFPNPEEASALTMALELGKKKKADVVIGTDPDADRIGIAVPEKDGKEFRLVTGNQLGALYADYVLGGRKEQGTLPEKPVLVKTIVTTELQREIAEHYGAVVYDTLTGFKHIASVMRELDADPSLGTYVLGGEESYGYLLNPEVRDKDSISAVLLAIEMALYLRSQGKSVLDRLNELYDQFGYYEELSISKYFEGPQGKEIMDGLMNRLRTNPPEKIGTGRVVTMRDILTGVTRDVASGQEAKDINLPSSNVLQFLLDEGGKVSARPSGTEPKIKFYASIKSRPGVPLDEAKVAVGAELQQIQGDIQALLEEAAKA